jgi:hypothetical protein
MDSLLFAMYCEHESNSQAKLMENQINGLAPYPCEGAKLRACSVGWWLMAGAGLF